MDVVKQLSGSLKHVEDRYNVTFILYCFWIIICTNSIDNNIDGIFLSDIRSDNKLHVVGPLKFQPCSVRGPAVFANTAIYRNLDLIVNSPIY